jgi:hypothetical protein
VINSANYSLLVENEEMGDRDVINALVSAAERGVSVKVAMTNSGNEYSSEFDQLVAAGVEVSTYGSNASLYIHAKAILADYGTAGAQVFIGSENFSNASLRENRELGKILSDPAIMQSIAATLTSDFNGGAPWSPNGTGATPRFSLTASPSMLTATPGRSTISNVTTATVTTATFAGFSSAVSFSASGLPTGVTATFTPASIAEPGSGTSTLNLSIGTSAATGTYTLTLVGTGGGLTQSATLTLTVVTMKRRPHRNFSTLPTYNTASGVTVTLGTTPEIVYGAALAPGFAALLQAQSN